MNPYSVVDPSPPSFSGTNLSIINARISGYCGLQQVCLNEKGIITAIMPMMRDSQPAQAGTYCQTIDLLGDWLSLGGVDLQINGGLGLAFPDLEVQHLTFLEQICDYLWQQGIDGFLPTIVTTSVPKIHQSLAVITEFIEHQSPEKPTAQVLGVHLEGPFLNHRKRGAHPAEYLLPLTLDNVQQVLGDYSGVVKIITLAPELDTTGKVIPYLRSLGITVSLGHSLANAAQAKQAFNLGATMVTHAFNAMNPLHHRQPGLLGEAIINPQVMCGLIADGKHVCSTMIEVLMRAADYDKGIFLVSDALAPIGLADGVYPWDNREIAVTKGTASLPDGTLAGTTIPLLAGVENLLNWGICDVERAINLATASPRQAIGLPELNVGQFAHLLRWRWDEAAAKLHWQRL